MVHIPLEEETSANSEGNTGKDVDSILARVNAPLTEGTPVESIANTKRALIPYQVENGPGNKSDDVENSVGDVAVVATPLVTLPVSPIPLGMLGFISDSPVASTGDKIVPVERSLTPTLTKSQRKRQRKKAAEIEASSIITRVYGGRIWCGWNPLMFDVQILEVKAQVILLKLRIRSSGVQFWLSCVYGENTVDERRDLWNCLTDMANIVSGPWLLIGDWNVIQSNREKLGGKRIAKRIYSKLDRGLMNEAWSNSIPASRIDLTSSLLLDHWGLCVRIPINVAAGPKPFRFLRVWHSQPVLKQVIAEAWSTRVNGDPIVKVVQKLRAVKKAVRVWNTTKFGSVNEHLISARTNLEECQVALSNEPMCAERIHSEEEARRNYEHALSNEEILVSQKARIKWKKDLDRSSKFFYQKIKAHRGNNNITGLTQADGTLVQDDNGIKDLLLQHYTSLFSSREHVNSPDAAFIRRTLLGEVVDNLEVNISRDKIKASIQIIDKGLNSTFITLIPKIKVANKIGDFRPIALCNVIYKIITKLLANRLSVVLDQIVGKEQNAFVNGRKIQDNLIIASKLLRGFGAKHTSPTLAWKVDLRKAYDSGNLVASPAAVKANCLATHQFFADDLLAVVRANITSGSLLFTYLGLPISDRGIRRLDCKPLMDKVVAATTRWAGMNLSMAGRIELLRAVATPMVLYWSSVYSILATVINLIERRMRNFAWGYNEINFKLHSMCWKRVNSPKTEGGFGLRQISDIDKAAKCSLAWDFLLSKDRLWVAWFNKRYLTNASYWSVIPKVNHSSIWKSIVSVRDTLKVQCSYRIGNGDKIKNFMDPWCEGQFLSEVFSYRTLRQVSSNKQIDLSSFIVQNQWQFDDVPFVVQQFFQQFRIHGGEDQLLWNNKSFTFKAA
ncbi:uncharacterized protein LOC132281094 [Cornus florida]|uniref:uncharacterized protein LOC132281094 n=1 Tax=Cornus florida TaxID=4283 RepID=UPI00289C2D1D|nr:uncharacterized protein LOC132281094 [Cornus florida]